jgi:hypothetical protein
VIVRSKTAWLCDCGSDLLFIDRAEVPRRRMYCITPGCQHYGVIVLEPLFEAKPEASALADSNLEAGVIPASGK